MAKDVSFSKAEKITSSLEMNRFQSMNKIPIIPVSESGNDAVFESKEKPMDFDLDGKNEYLICLRSGPLFVCAGYWRKREKERLGDVDFSDRDLSLRWLGSELPQKKYVAEVRYGDIDKDGDIDVAIKLTNGAIYVFHNLTK